MLSPQYRAQSYCGRLIREDLSCRRSQILSLANLAAFGVLDACVEVGFAAIFLDSAVGGVYVLPG